MEPIIQITKINKSFTIGSEQLHVLKDIDLTVQQGEFIAVLGPSGSGKSTLMNILGCMDKADSGSYFLNGQKIEQMQDSQLSQIRNREIGFIFQKYHLISRYNVQQNIVMPLIVRGMSYAQAVAACEEQIHLLGLQDRLWHKPNELSGGQQQRVAVARALAAKPSVLLADEPTGALDSSTGKEVLGLFQQLNKRGNTIIMITHDLNVAAYAQRVVHIIDGELFDAV